MTTTGDCESGRSSKKLATRPMACKRSVRTRFPWDVLPSRSFHGIEDAIKRAPLDAVLYENLINREPARVVIVGHSELVLLREPFTLVCYVHSSITTLAFIIVKWYAFKPHRRSHDTKERRQALVAHHVSDDYLRTRTDHACLADVSFFEKLLGVVKLVKHPLQVIHRHSDYLDIPLRIGVAQ